MKIEAVIAVRRESQSSEHRELLARAARRGIPVRWIEARHVRRYFETRNPQGIGLIVERPESGRIENLLEKARRVLILDGLSDPGNAGTLIRTAHLLGWDAVFFTDGSVSPWSEKTVRASAGAIGFIPVARQSAVRIAEAISNQGFGLLIADPKGEEAGVQECPERLVLILGGEARGSASHWPGAQRIAIRIQSGAVDSLGVAASGAILLDRYRV